MSLVGHERHSRGETTTQPERVSWVYALTPCHDTPKPAVSHKQTYGRYLLRQSRFAQAVYVELKVRRVIVDGSLPYMLQGQFG